MRFRFVCLFLVFVVGHMGAAQAQIVPPEDTGLESLYDRYEDQEVKQTEARKTEERKKEEPKEAVEQKEMTKISELAKLAPFEDVAVIQRRFLPKTERFEFGGSAAISTNNAYFNNVGASLRMAYYLSEKSGIEGTYIYLGSSERPITQGLRKERRISTESLVEPEAYYGISYKWVPVYGKMAWLGKKIIPFDINFSPGLGVTQTAGGNATTISIATSQLFALSKSSAIRWDLMWNFYSATTKPVSGSGSTSSSNHNDLILMIGYSFFFPEATYR